MTHNLAIGTVVTGLVTVEGVTGQTVGGVILRNAAASEHYIVGIDFEVVNHGQLKWAREEEVDTPLDVTV